MDIIGNPESSASQQIIKPCGLFAVDLDGTLLNSDRTLAADDRIALQRLGAHGVVRVIATGRSLFSYNTVEMPEPPIDYVIFSTGAGVLDCRTGDIIRTAILESREVQRVSEFLKTLRLDFMIHYPIPDNHRFAYYCSNSGNRDFDHRLELYRRYAERLSSTANHFGPATQLLAVVPADDAPAALDTIRRELDQFNVIQTTSPLDGQSTWIEIFPKTVSKSQTTAWLADKLMIEKRFIAAVGNDYNDLDLLEWTDNSYVVSNAPGDLKKRFPNVASNNSGGVAEAAKRWMKALSAPADSR
jgi:HAD superfamily hydrolase (TIGR01484 family)